MSDISGFCCVKRWWRWQHWWKQEHWNMQIIYIMSGCESQNGFSSVSVFWHSDVSKDELRHISLRAFVGQPMWKVVAASAHLPPWRLLSRQCSDQLLVTVPFLLLHRGHGTAYHLPSELFHPSHPFRNSWRHICLCSVSANFSLPSSLLLWLCKVPLHRSRDSVT